MPMTEGKTKIRVIMAAGAVVLLVGAWQAWILVRGQRRPAAPVEQARREPPRPEPRLRPTSMPTTNPG